MKCYRCDFEGPSSFAFGAREIGSGQEIPGVTEVCPQCEAPVGAPQPKAPTIAAVPAAKPKAAEPVDILSLAQARLAVLETEIEALRAKQEEASMLRRMIAAAGGHDTKVLKLANA